MNKKYLVYLFKEHKIALIFFFAMYIGLALSPLLSIGSAMDGIVSYFTLALGIMSGLSIFLLFVLPVLLFSNVHRRRSVDVYFALPVSRRDQLISNLIFIFLVAFGFFFITSLVTYLLIGIGSISFVKFLIILAFVAITFFIILVTNTVIYLLANNIFDGIVMIFAYLGITILINVTVATLVPFLFAGRTYEPIFTGIGIYASPLYMSIANLGSIFSLISANPISINIPYFIVSILLAVLACYGLKKEYIDRPSERAEQLSDGFFAYPFIINIYAICILFMLSTGALSRYWKEYIVTYLMLLICYVVATFVYRRKIQVKASMLITFAVGVVASILITAFCLQMKGFGYSYQYNLKEGRELVYYYQATGSGNDISKEPNHSMTEPYDSDIAWIYFHLEIPTDELDKYDDAIQVLENKRKENIEAYYERRLDELPNSNMSVSNYADDAHWNRLQYFNYDMYELFTLDELKVIGKYCEVDIDVYGEVYTLDEYLELE